jgi:hypothetical protein
MFHTQTANAGTLAGHPKTPSFRRAADRLAAEDGGGRFWRHWILSANHPVPAAADRFGSGHPCGGFTRGA